MNRTDSQQPPVRTPGMKTPLLMGIFFAALLALMGYGAYLDRSIHSRLIQVHDLDIHIRENIALSHLWFEELLNGDPAVSEADVWNLLDQTENEIRLLLVSEVLETPELKSHLEGLDRIFADYRSKTGDRFARRSESGAGSQSDVLYDNAFHGILQELDTIHKLINESITFRMDRFETIRKGIFILLFGLFATFAYILIGAERKRISALRDLSERNRELDASLRQIQAADQQLQASHQQLQATEQQLRAMNQELMASNQQLRASEESLRLSEQRYTTLFGSMAEGVALHDVIFDPSGQPVNYRIVEVNPRYEQILGIPASAVLGKLATEAYGSPIPPYLKEFTEVLDTGRHHRFETYFPPMDRHFEISVVSYRKGSFATIFTDISERKRNEAKLRQEERRTRLLLEISQHASEDIRAFLDFALEKALELTESQLGYIYHYSEENRQFELNSWSLSTMKECTILEKKTRYDLDKTGIWGEVVRQRQPIVINDFKADHPLKKGYPDGHAHLSRFMTLPVFDGKRIIAVVGVANKPSDYTETDMLHLQIFMDSVWNIVRVREAEAERQESLIKAQRLESLGVLAGGIAHDFNNLLTGVLGNLSMSIHRLEQGGDAFEFLREAENACARAQAMTRQLLTFSRGGLPVKQTLDLETVVRDAAAFALRGSNVKVLFHVPQPALPVEADPGQISQVVQNLLLNSAQAMPEGGTIWIALLNVTPSGADLPGPCVELVVEDQGSGIKEEHLGRIFDPYFTTKETGSGLGLAVTHSIIQKHDGTISVTSKPGSGTTFRIRLPASGRPAAVHQRVLDGLPTGTGRVLVMDDDEMIRKTACAILQELGYETLEASDGSEALSIYHRQLLRNNPVDLVMLDLTVPGGMGGLETLARLKEMNPSVRAIVSSGYSSDPVLSEYRAHGFHGMVPKPYRMADLARAVESVMKGVYPS